MKAITQKDLARLTEVGTYHQAILITSNECDHQPIIQWLGKAVDPSKLISRLDNGGLSVIIDGIAIQAWNVLLICPVAAAKKTFLSVGMSRCLHVVPTELLANKESTDHNLYFCIDISQNRLASYFHPDNTVLYGATGGILRSAVDDLMGLNRSSYRKCSLGSFIVNMRYEQNINASLLRWMRGESCCDTAGDEVTKNLYRALFAIVNPEQPTPPPLVAEAEAPIHIDVTNAENPITWNEWQEMLMIKYTVADDATFPIPHFVSIDDIRDANHADVDTTDEVIV